MRNSLLSKIIDQMSITKFDSGFYMMVADLLDDLLQNNLLIGIQHPLGFIIVTLQDWKYDCRLRLHIWPEIDRIYNNNQLWIHNHPYEVTSLLLMGAITNINYRADFESENLEYVVYKVIYNNNNSDLFDSAVTCSASFEHKIRCVPGKYYKLRCGEFHIADAEDGKISCSLVLNTKTSDETALVLGKKNDSLPEYIFTREIFDKNLLSNIILELITQLRLLAI